MKHNLYMTFLPADAGVCLSPDCEAIFYSMDPETGPAPMTCPSCGSETALVVQMHAALRCVRRFGPQLQKIIAEETKRLPAEGAPSS